MNRETYFIEVGGHALSFAKIAGTFGLTVAGCVDISMPKLVHAGWFEEAEFVEKELTCNSAITNNGLTALGKIWLFDEREPQLEGYPPQQTCLPQINSRR